MIAVIDTNVFVREFHLMRSGVGPIFLHYLHVKRGQLFIPDILRREYTEQTIALVDEQREEIKNAFDLIQYCIGERDEYQLPGEDDVAKAVEARLNEMHAISLVRPGTDALLVAAANRCMDKRAPSTKGEHGFKDCLIWENILGLPKGSEVHLVSHDKGFFEGDALKPTLIEEAQAREITVTGYKDLGAVVRLLQNEVPVLDVDELMRILFPAMSDVVRPAMQRWKVTYRGNVQLIKAVPYVTERVGHVFVEFEVHFHCETAEVNGVPHVGVDMVFEGSFVWFEETHQLTELQITKESLVAPDGTILVGNHRLIVGSGALRVGRGKVRYQRRGHLLPKEGARPAPSSSDNGKPAS